MLKKDKVLKDISSLAPNIFSAKSKELEILASLWQEIAYELGLGVQVPVPSNNIQSYFVCSIDGSQIYPDRHQGIPCYLLNTGIVQFFYGKNNAVPDPSILNSSGISLGASGSSWVKLDSEPQVYFADNIESLDADMINCKRSELELKKGLDIMADLGGTPALFLIDGSIIFWHLQSKPEDVKTQFLGSYLGILDKFYRNNTLFAGYISLPKSKELVSMARVALKKRGLEQNLDYIVDSDIISMFLKTNSRTELFFSDSPVCKYYPVYLKPNFFYIDLGQEIARIEVPNYIAQDQDKLKKVIDIITDQVAKGKGFPVCLSEAHEQAVVKSADREFFYNMLSRITQEHGQVYTVSQKSLKKRFVNI